MADWSTNDQPLGEATNGSKPGPQRDETKYQLAREKGWAEPVPFNYASNPATNPTATNGTEPAVDSGNNETPAWMSKAAKYEWQDQYGDLGPAIPALEMQLFGSEFRLKKGHHFDNLLSIKVVAEATERPSPVRAFADAGLHPVMLDNVTKSGYDTPTPIQAYTVPAVLKGRDVVAIAQTGSGKTAAYLIPTLSKLMGKAKKLCASRPNVTAPDYDPRLHRVRAEPLVLVIAPTRELCIQIFDEARRLCYRSMLRPCAVYGGGPVRDQKDDLAKGCDILVATPGRLIDFMRDAHVLTLARLRFTILDEADEMLHDDWQDELEKIMSGADANIDAQHQYLLFSATFNKDMRLVAKKHLAQDYVRIRIGRTGSTVKNIKQQIVWVDGNRKQEALYDLLIASPPARTLIFCRSKKTVDLVDDFLFNRGLPTTSIHSDRTQLEREDAMRSFRLGKTPILIASAVSARGIDVRNVMHVINFDLPAVEHGGPDEYIHRIGRTGRVGNEGLATSFYNERDEALAPFLAKLLVENGFPVPDFLEEYKPADAINLNFEDDSGDEENMPATNGTNTNGEGDAVWGAGSSAQPSSATDTWVSAAPAAKISAPVDDWTTSTFNAPAGAW